MTGITVTIAAATSSLIEATSTQFFKNISGGTNNVVTWQVNGVTGGNDTVGRIDSSGLYRAPSPVPSPATVNVAAVSSEESKLSATLALTITPAPKVKITAPSPPLTLTSGTGSTLPFAATVTGAPTNNVLWYVGAVGGSGVLGGNNTFGTINANGVYTAPLTPPIGSAVTVTAASADFPPSTDIATVTISGYSTSSFQGHFAFSIAGKNPLGAFFRAGSFVADGAGHLNAGLEDINDTSGPTAIPISFVGTYMIGADGRGTLQFSDSRTPATFGFVLVNSNQLQIIGFDATGTASGRANLQDISTFSASAMGGTHVFDFTGVDNSSNALSQIGEFTTDGQSQITGGQLDINDNGAITSQASVSGGTFAVTSATSGRGTAALVTSAGTLQFSFYIVSRGSAKFVGMDTTRRVAGVTMQQAPNATFDQTSLNGNYAFLLAGSGTGGTITTAGSFSADGLSGLAVTSTLDENISGTPPTNVAFGGSYTVASDGRGIATFATAPNRTYVFYLGPTGNAFFQEIDAIHPNIASDGIFIQQQNSSFSQSQILGTYAISTNGLSGSSTETITGDLAASVAGVISSGAIDINVAGTLTPGEAIAGTYASPSSTERGTLTLNPSADNRNFAVYVVNSAQVFLVGIDSGRLAAGALFRQF